MARFFTIAFLLLFCSLYAQSEEIAKPDYALIEKNVKDRNSPYYYSLLQNRYNRADTTMTLEERRHLYYGYSFQGSYSPYHKSNSIKELNTLLVLNNPNRQQMEQIITLSGEVLQEYPFSLRIKQYRIYFFKELGKNALAVKENNQLEILIDAILSTGDGTTTKQPIYVISPVNEYELINVMGFKYGGDQALMAGRYDYISLADNPYRLQGFYFDVSRSIDTLKF